MPSDAWIILHKELLNLFKDRRTLFTTFLLPLVVLPIIFIGMGTVLQSMEQDAMDSTYRIGVSGNNDPVFRYLLSSHLSWERADVQEAELSIMFPPEYAPGTAVQVIVSYDSSSRKLQYAAGMITQALVEYELELAQRLLSLHGLSHQDLHTISVVMNDTASEAARSGGSALAMLMPYFLVIFLFAGSMNAGLDTTSGEKERGGLAILLVNQVSRTSIAWGKILYVSVVALCSASATFLGLLISVSLPGGMNALTGSSGNAVTIGSDALAVIVAALLSTALLCATLVTLIGCVARTVKEGSSYVMPLYMLVVLVGVTTMYMDPSKNTLLFLVPIVNTIFLMKESFLGMHQAPHLLLTIGSNLIFASAGAMLVSRLFNSERILQTV